MMTAVAEGTLLWEPPEELKRASVLRVYMDWLAQRKGLHFDDYGELWDWSIADLEAFWESLWEFFAVRSSRPYERVLAERAMPGARWFAGAELNYAEHVFRNAEPERPALIFQAEGRPSVELSWDELQRQVGSIAAALRAMGI